MNHDDLRRPATPPRFRFTLAGLIGLIAISAVAIGAVSQVRNIGLIAGCYLVAIVVAWRQRRSRIAVACLTGLTVFALTLLASWVQFGSQYVMDTEYTTWVRSELRSIRNSVLRYTWEFGEFPDSLHDLADLPRDTWSIDPTGPMLDPWRHPYQYASTGNGFELYSFGRDGVPGGVGLDAEIYGDVAIASESGRLPLWQFLYETPGSGSVRFVAILASVAAGFIWYHSPPARTWAPARVIISVVITTVLSIFVAAWLALLHVGLSQSGH